MVDARQTSVGPVTRLDEPEPRWLGRLDFDLADEQGDIVGQIEMVLRSENVTLWLGSRTLAVMDRDRFRHWLVQSYTPLAVDDLIWFVADHQLYLSVDDRITYAVPTVVAMKLVTVI